jgi:hypothetical protein
MPQRSSDAVEVHSEKGISFGFVGVAMLALAGLLYAYKGDGYTLGLIWVLAIGGGLSLLYGIYAVSQVRKVAKLDFVCSYCNATNHLTSTPTEDFLCTECNRLIPVKDGKVLPVYQVRCGYCNELNYYSDKSEVLLCEKCNHEIPIANFDSPTSKKIPKAFSVQEDSNLYELVLVSPGNKTEEVIEVLQRMLALNRNQVKNILNDVPAVLLTGLTRRKVEALQAQLAVHDAVAEFNPINQ